MSERRERATGEDAGRAGAPAAGRPLLGRGDRPDPVLRRRAALLHGLLLLLLLALPFLVYPQFVSDDLFLYTYDSGQSHLARFRILARALQEEGTFPLWQTISYGGGPFHANPENPTFYPPVLLAAALAPPLLAMNLTILAHLSLGLLGMFLLVRRLARRVAPIDPPPLAGPLVAALLFGLNLFTRLEHFNLVGYGAAHALLPWVLLAGEALLHGPRPRRAAALLGLLLGLLVATGGLYVWAYGILGLALWLALEGLLAGTAPRRRLLGWGLLAGALGVLLVAARLAPFFDWVATTNRVEAFDPEEARGVTLGGHGVFVWARFQHQLLKNTGQGATLLLLLPCLAWLRCRPLRSALLLGAFGVLVAAGPGYDLLHRFVPPFDVIRNANRGYTLANLFLPLAAGLGLHGLLARVHRHHPRVLADGALALLLGAACLPSLLDSGRHSASLARPWSQEQALAIHPNWRRLAAELGSGARATCLNVQVAGTRNEQFIAAALGLETSGGFLGYAYPAAIARHAYNNHQQLDAETRLRRLGVLSVAGYVWGRGLQLRDTLTSPEWVDPFPGGIDGPERGRNPWSRPRAFIPAAALAIVGDDAEGQVLYTLFDLPEHDPRRVTLLSYDAAQPPPAEELADLAALVLAGAAVHDPSLARLRDRARQAGVPLLEVSCPPRAAERTALAALAASLAQGTRDGSGAARLERLSGNATLIERETDRQPGWLVASETWSLHRGWQVTSDAGRPLDVRRADGVASALHLRDGESALLARYAPGDVALGWALLGAGLLVALALLLPWRSAPRRASALPRERP